MAAAEAANCIMEVSEAGVAGKGLRGGGRSEPGPYPRAGPGHAELAPQPWGLGSAVPRGAAGLEPLPRGPGLDRGPGACSGAGPGLAGPRAPSTRPRAGQRPRPGLGGAPRGAGRRRRPSPGAPCTGSRGPRGADPGPPYNLGLPRAPRGPIPKCGPCLGDGAGPDDLPMAHGGTRSVAHGPRAPPCWRARPIGSFLGCAWTPQDHLPSRGGRPQVGK